MTTENERLQNKNHTLNNILKGIKEELRWCDNKKESIEAVEKIIYFNKKRAGIMD